MFYFIFSLQNQRTGEQKSCPGRRLVLVGGRVWWEKGVAGWIWCKICAHMYINAEVVTVETTPGIMGGKDKGEH
jgi:hypothetical protein